MAIEKNQKKVRAVKLSKEAGLRKEPLNLKEKSFQPASDSVKYISYKKNARIVSTEEFSEKQKKMMLWGGVGFFMLVFIVLWALTFKNNLSKLSGNKDADNSKSIGQMTDEFNKNIQSITEEVEKLKNLKAVLESSTTTPPVSSTTNNDLIKPDKASGMISSSTKENFSSSTATDQIDYRAVKKRIEALEQSLSTSSENKSE
jgi:hypothetical protein